jgi:hypothetical protein
MTQNQAKKFEKAIKLLLQDVENRKKGAVDL